jgi:hypothetical protein
MSKNGFSRFTWFWLSLICWLVHAALHGSNYIKLKKYYLTYLNLVPFYLFIIYSVAQQPKFSRCLGFWISHIWTYNTQWAKESNIYALKGNRNRGPRNGAAANLPSTSRLPGSDYFFLSLSLLKIILITSSVRLHFLFLQPLHCLAL